MRVLVTGDRWWGDPQRWPERWLHQEEILRDRLTRLHTEHPDTLLVEGGARGADHIAGIIWIGLAGPDRLEIHPAEWKRLGLRAGPVRNQFMLDESKRRAAVDGHHLERVIVCHSNLAKSTGTKDMVSRAQMVLFPEQIEYLT